MLHIAADTLAALVECGLFLRGQGQLHHLLHAVGADDAGHTGKQAALAILAAQLHAGGHDGLLIVEHDVSHTRSGGGDAVLGTLLAHVSHPAAADGLLLQGGAVKAEALVGFGPLVQRHALEADAGPGRELLAAVLTQHVAGDGLVVDAGLPRQCAQQAGGVQTGAGAEHAAPGQTHAQRQLAGHDVAGVGDVDKHAVKAALLDLVGIAPHGGNGEIHLRQTVMGLQQLDFAHAVDDDIALAQIGEVTGPYRDAVG